MWRFGRELKWTIVSLNPCAYRLPGLRAHFFFSGPQPCSQSFRLSLAPNRWFLSIWKQRAAASGFIVLLKLAWLK